MDEKKRTFLIYSEQFETFHVFGDIETTLQAIRYEFLVDMVDGDEETIIRIKRHDMTEKELAALPVD